MGLIDLFHQVKQTLRWQNGGTGNAYGYGSAVVERLLNREGADIPVGTIVQREGTGRIEVSSGLDSSEVLGIVVGYWTSTGLLVAGDCPDNEQCAVMTKGRTRVLVDATVNAGEYAFQSGSTPGSAYSAGSAAVGAFGVLDTDGGAGDMPRIHLFGSPLLAAGSTSPLTTKGDLWGFSTVDDRVPVGANGTVLTADSTDAQGVAYAAIRRGVLVTFNAPTNGQQADFVWPWDGTLVRWTLLGDASGTATVDPWQDTYANYPPTVGDTMVGGGGTKPNISGPSTKGQGTPTSWAKTTFARGDTVRVNVDAVSGLSRLALVLEVTTP